MRWCRILSPDVFTRQEKADGYVPDSFALELKGKSNQLVAAKKGNILIAKPKQVMTKQEA